MISKFGQAAFLAACLIWILPETPSCQIPSAGKFPGTDVLSEASGWERVHSPHVARQLLHDASFFPGVVSDDAEFSFHLVKCAFEDQDYQSTYFNSLTYLDKFSTDNRRADILFIEGISAFQTKRIDTAYSALNAFLTEYPSHPLRGVGYYWRARCALEQKDWQSAETDFQRCTEDSSVHSHDDDALLGWSLALERRGEIAKAIENIQRLLTEYPQSDLQNDARLRLASLKLRLGDSRAALMVLQETSTPYRYQREESLLLRAEANFQMGLFDSARVRYERFIKDFPQSPYLRKAQYGLVWANLQLGNKEAAQTGLDRLGDGNDTLAMIALYQNAVIALLNNDTKEATARFDTLVQMFPYEQFSDNAYFQLGMNAYRSQHYREARKYFQIASRLYPESELRLESYRMMGEACLALSDFSNAQYSFSQIRKTGAPDSLLIPAMFQEGIALYHLGRFKSSAERFDELLKKLPGSALAAEAYVWKGEALYQDYRFDEAEKTYADALKLFPKNPKQQDALYGIAWSYFEQKKFRKAIEAFDKFISHYPHNERNIEASLRKADCYFFLGEYTASEELYKSLTTEKADGRYNEYAAFQVAMSYVQRGDADRGTEQLRGFLARFPASIYCEVVQFNIAWTFFSKERFPTALEEFQTFLLKYPQSQLLPRVFFNMGDAFYNIKSYDSARVYYSNVLEQFPQSPLAADALSGLEFTYRAEGKPVEAVNAIEKYVNSKPSGSNQEELILKKSDILFDQGDYPASIQEYQRVLSLTPSRAQQVRALQQLGRAYELQNNPAQAIIYYKQIVDSFMDVDAAPSVALALGHTYLKTKQYVQAGEIFKSFDGKFPTSPLISEAQFQHGIVLLNLKDSVSAFTQFQLVVNQHPSDIFAERSRLQLAKLHQRKKQYQASLDTLEALVARRNDDLAAEALLIMGENYLLTKRNGDALQAFLDVVEQYTEFGLLVERAKLGAGESYVRLQERTKAKKMYKEIVDAPVDPEMKKAAQERLRKLR